MSRIDAAHNIGEQSAEGKPIDRAEVESLLLVAKLAQHAFWDALFELECALDGIEIDAAADLEHTTVDTLLASAAEDGDDDDTEVA